MTDDPLEHGLGWLPSPDDERDWPVHALYAATGAAAPAELPSAYHVPTPLYPVVDQGSSPMCVAYRAAGEQGWYDLRDTGLAQFHEAMFFRPIGGTTNGAVIRDALSARLANGYPVVGHAEQAASHCIAAYYSVPVTQADLCAAILSFGPVVIGAPWASSWFHPVDGALPAFDRPSRRPSCCGGAGPSRPSRWRGWRARRHLVHAMQRVDWSIWSGREESHHHDRPECPGAYARDYADRGPGLASVCVRAGRRSRHAESVRPSMPLTGYNPGA